MNIIFKELVLLEKYLGSSFEKLCKTIWHDLTPKEKFFGFIGAVALIFALHSWYGKPETVIPPPTPAQPTIAVTIPGLNSTKVAPPQVITIYTNNTNTVFVHDTATKTLEEEVIATGVVPPWKGSTNVYAYLNKDTGVGRLSYAQQPALPELKKQEPFFAFTDLKSIGAYYGYGIGAGGYVGSVMMFDVNWDLVRVGNIVIGLKEDTFVFDSKINSFLMGGAKYQW